MENITIVDDFYGRLRIHNHFPMGDPIFLRIVELGYVRQWYRCYRAEGLGHRVIVRGESLGAAK